MIDTVTVTDIVVEQVPGIVVSELIVPTVVDTRSIEYVVVSETAPAEVVEVD